MKTRLTLILITLTLVLVPTAQAMTVTNSAINNWMGIAKSAWSAFGYPCYYPASWRWDSRLTGYDAYVDDIGGCLGDDEDNSASTADIRFSTKGFKEGRKIILCSLVVHEYGHLVGFNHSSNPSNVMYPVMTDKNVHPWCR